ncbi:Tetracycline repressor protein class B from transposon Tn10 [compost metagenome]|uniref:TetR family transcriptional regulator n=1 Tax=Paenibacillus stellifer TaxID=169760 RepID=A0A089LXK5_9BACL|nr:TetR/AcrR family transcriptional regulator [Paenibacillus stellifer]AIQ63958.1 TetR family transcriptional regulator [Paenibacillus stellifer]
MSPRAGLDKSKIVAAAVEIADEQGVEGVTLAALAARLGVRSPSLYNHIDGQNGLRTLLAVHGLNKLGDEIGGASQGLSGSEAIQAMGKGYAEFAKRHPGLYEMTLQAPDGDHPELIEAGERVLKLIIDLLKPYNLDEQAELHAVRGLRSILHGFASLEQKGGFGMPLDTGLSLQTTLEAYLSGIDKFRGL